MNKICVLVGVGPGLGLAIARRFGQEGYQMALLARRPEALTEYTKILCDAGIQATGFEVDAADSASIAAAFTEIQQQKSGTILLTGGGLALYPSSQLISLGIGKAAIRYLALGLAEELKADGIHIATVTICGTIAPETKFAPEAIAEVYWQLHQQTPETWQVESVYQ